MVAGRGRRRPTLATQALLAQLAVVAVVLAVVGGIAWQQSDDEFGVAVGRQLGGVAQNVANTPVVRSEASDPHAASLLAPVVDRNEALSGAWRVTVVDPDGVVVASTDPTILGRPAELGGSDALQGRGWTGDVTLDDGTRVVSGQVPVLDDDARLVAVAVAEEPYPSPADRLRAASGELALFVGVALAISLVGSWGLSRLVRRGTHGLEPDEIAELAEQRAALLRAMREGVVATDGGRVTLVNDAALDLLGLTGDPVGRFVDELGLPATLTAALAAPAAATDEVVVVGSRVLVLSRRPVAHGGSPAGTVVTLLDRTELTGLRSRLAANLTLTETLRAQTHEFTNRLHTISGLVQLGEYDEVHRLVGTLTAERAAVTDHVTGLVADRVVAALLVAKTSVADEAGVDLVVDDASRLGALPDDVAADLATVLGNLVDNAIDACRGRSVAGGRPGVTVQVRAEDGTVTVVVADDGPGVPPARAETVFERGFTTKPGGNVGRGVGLAVVRLLTAARGGDVRADLDRRVPGRSGAVFVARLPVGEDGRP